jgi:3-hydroxyisobutyrate dehydrogenase
MPLGDKVYSTYQAAMKAYGENAPHLSIVRLMEEQHDQILRS